VELYPRSGRQLTSDGPRNYFWDAENRLVAITYAAQPGKQTSFVYDGLGRRTTITTSVSGSAATTDLLPVVRLAPVPSGQPERHRRTRAYFDKGEFVTASGTGLYHGPDRLGSVPRSPRSAAPPRRGARN
jgi:YD repeat-containing protein